jgi:hypothetical protein
MSAPIFTFRPPSSQPQQSTNFQRFAMEPDDRDTQPPRETYHSVADKTEEAKFITLQSTLPTPLFDVENKFTHTEQDMKPSYQFNVENAVTLLVDPKKQSMIVHTSYLTRNSEFFVSALKEVWIEGQTRTIELDEETPELMAYYLDWMYTTQLPTKGFKLIGTESSKVVTYDLLAKLYVLGERRLDSRLRNAITAEFIRLRLVFHNIFECQQSRRASCINIIYQGTSVGSPVRRLMVDLSLRSGCSRCFADSNIDKAFLVDLTRAFFTAVHSTKSVEEQRLILPNAEDYHV